MDFDLFKYELQLIDGSKESLLKGVRLILKNINSESTHYTLPHERNFFELFTKSLLNWIGKGDQDQMAFVLKELNVILMADEDLAYAVSDLSPKKKLGSQLNYICQLLSIYIKSDLEAKDRLKFLSGGKAQQRIRELLLILFEMKPVIYQEDLLEMDFYRSESGRTKQEAIYNDLRTLAGMGLVKKFKSGISNIYYELTSKAFYYRTEISALEQDMEKLPEIDIAEAKSSIEMPGLKKQYKSKFRTSSEDVFRHDFDENKSDTKGLSKKKVIFRENLTQ